MFDIAVVTPVVIGLTQLAKMYVTDKYTPLVALGLGIASGFLFVAHDTATIGLFNGLTVGLAACGLFEVGGTIKRNLIEK